MSDRDRILFDLQDPKGGLCKPPTVKLKSVPRSDLWQTFNERFIALGGELANLDEVSELGSSFYLEPHVPERVRAACGPPTDDVWHAEVGVSLAEFAVAETGSFIVASRLGSSRLASLAPPIHLVVVERESIVASLEEALVRMPQATAAMVTGPSRTADIEGVLVRGIHGPKRVIVAVLPP